MLPRCTEPQTLNSNGTFPLILWHLPSETDNKVKAAFGESTGLDWVLKHLTPKFLLQHYQSNLYYSRTWSVSVQVSIFTDTRI
jgi:hypothetical protein